MWAPGATNSMQQSRPFVGIKDGLERSGPAIRKSGLDTRPLDSILLNECCYVRLKRTPRRVTPEHDVDDLVSTN